MGERYVPRPYKLPGLRTPVFMMRRFFNFMGGGRCQGIDVTHRGNLHGVTIHFNSESEASGFYRSLQAIYDYQREEDRRPYIETGAVRVVTPVRTVTGG